MRSGVFFLLSFVSVPFSANAATYNVPSDGTIAAATTYVNSLSGSDPVIIAVSGNQTNTGSTTNIIKHAVDINGSSGAIITGSVAFTNGTNKNSSISDLTFNGASNIALTNGTGGGNIAGHTMTLNNVIFDSNINTAGTQGSAGAILNYGGMTINNGTFTNNSSVVGGAAIVNTYDGHLDINNSSFVSNTTVSGSGGAIALNSNYEPNTITGTSFTSNTAATGGAILSTNSDLTLDAVEMKNNTATTGNGGGVYWHGGPDNKLIIKNASVFDGNTSATDGGAVIQYANGDSYIDDTIFSNNKVTSGNGGALSTIGDINTITNTKFLNNQASRMGGGWYSSGNNMSINNVLFDGNTAGTDGGGLWDYGGLTSISIINTTISNNTSTAGNGGGAVVGGNVSISNTSFTNNHADAKYGGGLYSTGMDSHLDNVSFDGNTAVMGGGIIHWAYTTTGGVTGGVMTIGGNSVFRNNTATQGGAIFNLATINLDTTNGNILFENNSATDGADIYNNTSSPLYGTVNIIGDANTLSMDGGIAGGEQTIVNKTGKNDLVFLERADNTQFLGTFTQTAGKTTVYADNFFGGINNITDGSTLYFANSANVDTLNFKTGGILDVRHKDNSRAVTPFTSNTLTVANLSSDDSANIMMQTDGTTSDLLKVTETATGDFTINFNAVGSSPTSEKILVVDLADAATQNANFMSAGVDVGAWKYDFTHEADANWYLEKTGEASIDAQNVRAIPAFHLSMVKTGLNELRKRMGALRNNNQNEKVTGFWVRSYGKNMHIHENSGAEMNLYGVEGGIDGMVNAFGGKLYLGVMAGTLVTEDIEVKSSAGVRGAGHGNAPSVGLYTTWMENNNSNSRWFVDATVRHFWVHTDIRRDDGLNGYDVRRNFFATSLEGGYLFYMESPDFMDIGSIQHSHISIEPKAELRYKSGNGQKFTMDDGINGTVDTTESFSTHFNLQASYLPNGTVSTWKPFVELGVYNEFKGKTEMQFGSEELEASDTGGMGFEFTVGTNAAISKDSYAYGAITAEVGEVYTSYLANVGIRVKF